ncbi:MAG: DNA internalization-related competence protein ComEC/Rec2 [Gammaproteobacteria bacterium]
MRRAAFGALLGVLSIQYLPALPTLWPAGLALAVLVHRLLHPQTPAALVWFALGAFWAAWRAAIVLDPALPPMLEGEPVVVVGRVHGLAHADGRRTRFLFDVEEAVSARRHWPLRMRMRMDWYAPAPAVRAGERWRLTVRPRRPHGFANPGGFDYEAWLFQGRVRATAWVLPASTNALLSPARPGLHPLREALARGIEAALQGAPRRATVVALALGVDDGLTASEWDTLRRTGTTHLISISGLHISLAALLAFGLLRALWAMSPRACARAAAPRVAAAGAVLAAAAYAALAGGSVPTQRSLVLVAVAMAGAVALRTVAPGRLFAAALLAVLALDPLAVLSIGFWLSFGAAGLILYRFGARARAEPGWRRAIDLHLAVAVGLAPALAFAFGQNPLLGPLANAFAVPWTSYLVVPAVLGGTALLAWAPALAAYVLQAAHWTTVILWRVLDWLARFDAAVWWHGTTVPIAVIAGGVGVALLLAPRGLPGRWTALAWLLLAAAPPVGRPPPGQFELSVLDVGQGLAVVARTQRHALLFDTGPTFGPDFDAGAAVVVPYLQRRGVRVLDAVVVSHGDIDHAGGLASVRGAMHVRRLWSSVPAATGGLQCRRGGRWRWDGVEFRFLHPPQGWRSGDNDSSCVLRIAGTSGAALLAGDIERSAERALLDAGADALRAEIVVVPHHGSRSSSTPEFVAAVGASLAVVSSGYRNRFGFPAEVVVQRWRRSGAHVVDTARDGAVTIDGVAALARPVLYRHDSRRYWND